MEMEAILSHLLFHKALISDSGDRSERINRYLKIIEEMQQGLYIGIKDPTERSIATVFELVIDQRFDPWDINISEFTKMYLKRMKKEDYIDFVTAGRLVFLAWYILKLQSDKLLLAALPPEPQQEMGMDIDFYNAPEDLDFTHAVIQGEPPIQEMARNQPSRPVTLIDLVTAFDEAIEESSRYRQRVVSKKIKPINFHENVHREDLNEDLELTWSRILEFNGDPIPLRNLHSNDAWDTVTVFMAVLFLAKMKRLKVWQKGFPTGDIFVQKLDSSVELPLSEIIVQKEIRRGEKVAA